MIELGAGTGLAGMVASALGNAGLLSIAPLFVGLATVNSVATIIAAALGTFLQFCRIFA